MLPAPVRSIFARKPFFRKSRSTAKPERSGPMAVKNVARIFRFASASRSLGTPSRKPWYVQTSIRRPTIAAPLSRPASRHFSALPSLDDIPNLLDHLSHILLLHVGKERERNDPGRNVLALLQANRGHRVVLAVKG